MTKKINSKLACNNNTVPADFVALLKGAPLPPVDVALETAVVAVAVLTITIAVDPIGVLDVKVGADPELSLTTTMELDVSGEFVKTTKDEETTVAASVTDGVPSGVGVGRAGVKVFVLDSIIGVPRIVVALSYISGTPTVLVWPDPSVMYSMIVVVASGMTPTNPPSEVVTPIT